MGGPAFVLACQLTTVFYLLLVCGNVTAPRADASNQIQALSGEIAWVTIQYERVALGKNKKDKHL
jgi:hypothetical protein